MDIVAENNFLKTTILHWTNVGLNVISCLYDVNVKTVPSIINQKTHVLWTPTRHEKVYENLIVVNFNLTLFAISINFIGTK